MTTTATATRAPRKTAQPTAQRASRAARTSVTEPAPAPQVQPEATTFTTREVPWMKIGKLTDKPKTAKEAMTLAGLDFEVHKRTAGWKDDDGNWHEVDHRRAIVTDGGDAFEFVSPDYQVLQYGEAFAFMDAISPHYVAAGALRHGRQGFLVVRPQIELSPGGDQHDLFAVLRTSHDRSKSIEVMVMPLRGKCMNQLTLRSFTKGVPHKWSVQHTTTMRDRLVQAQGTMAQLDEYGKAFSRLAERLMLSRPTEEDARKVLDRAIKNGGKGRNEVVDSIVDLWHNDVDHVGYNDTAWGLVNATSEYLDWRKTRGTSEARFSLALQGYHHNAINEVTRSMLALAA